MPTPIVSVTAGEIVRDLARMMNDEVAEGTADSGGATTIVDAKFLDADDSRLKGPWFLIYKGVGNGRTGFNESFAGTTVTIKPTGTAITSTSQYLFTRAFHPDQYIRAVVMAQQLIVRTNLKERIDRSIIIGSALINGAFYLWTLGAALAPDNWTFTGAGGGAIAREATITKVGLYSVKLSNALNNTQTLAQSLTRVGAYAGVGLSAKGWVYADFTTPAVTLEFTDGQTTQSKTHGGTGWEYLETPTLTVSVKATVLTTTVKTASGAAKDIYASGIWIPAYPQNGNEHDIDSDNNFVWIRDNLMVSEGHVSGTPQNVALFSLHIPPNAWDVLLEGTRRLRLRTGAELQGHVLSMEGWANHTELTAMTTAWTGNEMAILPIAREILLVSEGESSWANVMARVAESNHAFGISKPGNAVEVN